MNDANERYPALMNYIHDRSANHKWHEQLNADKNEAFNGGLKDVVTQLRQAQADYGQYPYNAEMGRFLGLPLEDNHEPAHGYYMACGVMAHYALGEATREAESLIAAGKPLRIVAARSTKDRKPIRFYTFTGSAQIKLEGNEIVLNNGKRKGTLRSNWSVETAVVKLADALRTGAAYGEAV